MLCFSQAFIPFFSCCDSMSIIHPAGEYCGIMRGACTACVCTRDLIGVQATGLLYPYMRHILRLWSHIFMWHMSSSAPFSQLQL